MTNAAFGAQKPDRFQVSISSLTLGTLYEAILAFSSQDRFETFWPSVCQNVRWLIPSRRVGILLHAGKDRCEIAGTFERGQFQKPPENTRYIDRKDPLCQALTNNNARWITKPSEQFQQETNHLATWLFQGQPDILFALPMKAEGEHIGTLLFVMGAITKTDQAMLNTLGTIYTLHVGMTYTLIRVTEERSQMQNQLIMQEKMASLGNLVAGIAHEVNTPIGAINSASDVLTRCIGTINEAIAGSKTVNEIKDNTKLQRALKLFVENNRVIATAGQRVASLVQSLKKFARLDEAEFQKADLHEGIESTRTLLYHELKNKVEVITEYGEIPPIHCYPNQLNQVFMNLLVNAIQAIEDRGKIHIRTFLDDTNVYIQIADTGKGIPAAYLDRIFDPGFTTKGVGVGTGLGLSISYNIVQKHKGKILVESKKGEGTTFTVVLPRESSR